VTDYLVRLYDLPSEPPLPESSPFLLYRPMRHEAGPVLCFVEETFSPAWAAECDVAFSRTPVSIWLAVERESGEILGFCCHDCTGPGFLGPIGVSSEGRGRGVGRSLLLRVLHTMRLLGNHYCIIGGVGPPGFFETVLSDAVMPIPGSDPGPYSSPLSWG
jgi:hypothetical protein